ncbi:TadE/TadG family type IV pilus assembly protein [Oceaniglobus trochenteri]|uniref:TadE/TadG family type IV pilus assembly protein n=1 Tax=Oceaniglobus trochenteri TaxID=2763260 RepID=UPI001CFFA2EE|nr:hypothetical protein [Oceaniglobus trochenteri]
MNIMTHLRRKLRAFAKDSTGSYTVEAVLILPLLLWAMLATFTFVDGYRMQALNLRATYTISDLLTRQWNPVDRDFMVGLGKYHEFLTNNGHDTSLRVTVVYYDAEKDNHVLVWSYTTDASKPKITKGDLPSLASSLPVLANADSAVIVETWMDYEPPFKIGLPETVFNNRVVSSPRFVPQLLWTGPSVS